MRTWWRSIASKSTSVADGVEEVRRAERAYAALDDQQLGEAARNAATLPQVVAVTTLLASRVLGIGLFDVQLQAALALADGKIVEMQPGEGKPVAAVPAIAWFARGGQGVHVLTANDYLARRDARWMGGIYDREGPAMALRYVTLLPAVLVVIFGIFYLMDRTKGGYRKEHLSGSQSEHGIDVVGSGPKT